MVAKCLAVLALALTGAAAFVAPTMMAGSTSRQSFVAQSLTAGAAVFAGAAVAGAIDTPVDLPSNVNLDDPNKLPEEFSKDGPGLLQGKPLSGKNKRVANKLEDKVDARIEAKNAKGPKSGNRDVEKRIDRGQENGSAKPLTL